MARPFFIVFAFVLSVNLMIPVVNMVSPFASSLTTAPSTGITVPNIVGAAGCTTSNLAASGSISCSAGVNGAGTSSVNAFGSVLNSLFIFGNWPAAVSFLLQIAGGVLLPSYFLAQWLGTSAFALLLIAVYQGIVWLSYSEALVYLFSGRDLGG